MSINDTVKEDEIQEKGEEAAGWLQWSSAPGEQRSIFVVVPSS